MAFRAGVIRIMGRPAEGAAEARTALDLARQIGHAAGEATALVELSLGALDEERAEDAVEWALQAQQVDFSQLSDWRARGTRWVLPCVLVTTDHLDGAREACEEVLALSRAAGDRNRQVDMLSLLARLARQDGRLTEAGAFLAACAETALADGGYLMFLVGILDEGALQCATAGRPAAAIALWSAHRAQSSLVGLGDAAHDVRHREPLVRAAREALDAQRLRAAEQRGAAMTLTAAVDFAVMMTGPSAPVPDRPAPLAVTVTAEPGSRLSARERELVALVARGCTDAEIAAKLFISIRTVRSHLDRIRDKSGYRRRADLTRLALREGIV
jgi:DNA-binding CsgD family transcriptional regulator